MADPRAPILLENEPGQEFYEVEAILGRRRNERSKTYEYLIKWEHWPHADNSWEAEHRLKYCKDLKADFDRAHPDKRMAAMPTTVAKKPKTFMHPITKPCMRSPSKATAKSPAAEAVTPKQVPAYQSLVLTAVACKKEHAQPQSASAKIITASKTLTSNDVSKLKESTAATATPQSEPSTVSSPAVTSVEPQHKQARHSPAMTVDLSKQQTLEQGIGMASMAAHKVHVHPESSAKGISSQDDAATDSCAKAKLFQAEAALSTHVTIPSTSRVPPAKPPGTEQQPSPSQLVDSSDFLPQLKSDSSSSSSCSETSSSTSSESSSSSDSSSSDDL